MTPRTIAAAVGCAVLLLAACGDDSTKKTADPGTFTGAVCSSVKTWMDDMVDETNRFTHDSQGLSVADRRARYADAFDNLAKITDTLTAALQHAPVVDVDTAKAETVRRTMIDATGEVQQQIADNKQESAALPDTDYSNVGVLGGQLFPGTEKAMSTILKTMNAQGTTLGIDGLTGTCGRR